MCVFFPNPDNPNTEQSQLRTFVFLGFMYTAGGDLHALLAALLPLPERINKVCRREISHAPLPLLLGGLLGEGEALIILCRLANSENVVQDGQGNTAIIASNASHVMTRTFFILVHLFGKPTWPTS